MATLLEPIPSATWLTQAPYSSGVGEAARRIRAAISVGNGVEHQDRECARGLYDGDAVMNHLCHAGSRDRISEPEGGGVCGELRQERCRGLDSWLAGSGPPPLSESADRRSPVPRRTDSALWGSKPGALAPVLAQGYRPQQLGRGRRPSPASSTAADYACSCVDPAKWRLKVRRRFRRRNYGTFGFASGM